MLEFIRANKLFDICFILGVAAILTTYIGAPLLSKKTGKHYAGFPCVGGILIAVGFLTSPAKWLAVLGILDFGIPLFRIIKGRMQTFNASVPRMLEGCEVVEYTTYYNRYGVYQEPQEDDPEKFREIPVERYAIIRTEGSFALLSLDYQFNTLIRENYPSVAECKRHTSPKAYNRWINAER